MEVIQAVRGVIPETTPLFVRISTTEWMEYAGKPSWDVPSSIRLAKLLPPLGVDLLDCSSGGNNAEQKIVLHPYYQVDNAGKIREALKADGLELLIGAVGMISEAEMAKNIVQDGTKAATIGSTSKTIEVELDDEPGRVAQADVVLVARQFLREPNWVLKVADALEVDVKWANQYMRGPRSKKPKL